MAEDKHTRYHQRQREKGLTQCTTWVPAVSKEDLLEYARKLRKRYEAKMEGKRYTPNDALIRFGRICTGESVAPEPEANAYLIAAAPELLEALEMVLDDPNALDGRPRTEDVVFEAIAKAHGETP